MSKVSVLVPIFNNEQYLEECLDSLLAQTLKDIEVICINDGSTDGSPWILKQYAKRDNRIRVIDQENGGFGKAMNAGMAVASGDWIGFVESDDYILPQMYERLYDLGESMGLDFVKSSCSRFYGEGESRTFEPLVLTSNEAYLNTVVNPSVTPGLLDINMVNVTGIYRRSFLEENQIRYNETPGASYQDNGFWFQVFMAATRAYFIDDRFYMIRRDNPNSSVKSRAKAYCIRDEYDFIFSIMSKNPEVFDRFIYAWCKKRFSNYVGTFNRIDPSLHREFLQVFAKDYRDALENGWINWGWYNPKERKMLEEIIDDPEGYYYNFLNRKVRSLRKKLAKDKGVLKQEEARLSRLRSSKAYLLGRAFAAFKKRKQSHKGLGSVGSGLNHPNKQYEEPLIRWYEQRTGRAIDLSNPQSFTEKIQYSKLFDSTPLKTKLADKYEVRDWVASKIGEEHLIPLLGVWDSFDEINFDELPQSFVLKVNHGSGMNIVVKDKRYFDYDKAKSDIDRWLETDFEFTNGFELHYAGIKRRVIAEEYIESLSVGCLRDYRFFCFDGKPYQIWVDQGSGTSQHFRSVYSLDWELLPLKVSYERIPDAVPRPECLDEMITMAEKLSEGFNFVRVDFYVTEEGIKFGEMTFTPQTGLGKWVPEKYNLEYGKLMPLHSREEK